jgi:hypothetical protein
MKQPKLDWVFLVFSIAFIFQQRVAAQNQVIHSTLGNGGAVISNGNYRLVGTLGQSTGGVMSNASNVMRSGFWHVVKRVPNTPAGTSIVVQPVDPATGTAPVTLTFSEVMQNGTSDLATSSSGPPPPVGFNLGAPPIYYEITTTAVFTGAVSVCINYGGTSFDTDDNGETTLRLFHFENGMWVDQTASLNTVTDIICASVTSLSPFVILKPGEIEVVIDIKPGSDPNCINLGSGGVVPVAILGSTAFDVATINHTTLKLEGSHARAKGKSGNIGSFEDVNTDGFVDLVVHFPVNELNLTESDVEATLTGTLHNGTPIEGTDDICIVPAFASKNGLNSNKENLPNAFGLAQNYPNPFNPETEIRFELPEASHVIVKIFNTLGEEIRTLTNAPYKAGYHRVRWDGKDKNGKPVVSGIYLYQLRVRKFSQVKKMSLLR